MHKDTIAMTDSDLSSSANVSAYNITNTHKRGFVDDSSVKSYYDSPSKKKSRIIAGKKIAASVDLKHFEVPLFSAVDGDGSGCESIRLHADQPYTIGRRHRDCQFVFRDRRVSKQHCQIFFDGSLRKLYILGGVLLLNDSTGCLVHEFRNRVISCHANNTDVPERVGFRAASNGVFVNGVKVRRGMVVELSAGDKVLLVCGKENTCCGIENRIGFVIQRIFLEEGVIKGCDAAALESMQELATVSFSGHSQGLTSSGKRNRRVFAMKANGLYSEIVMSNYKQVVGRANFLLDRCRDILFSDDPISRLLHAISDTRFGCKCAPGTSLNNISSMNLGNTVRLLVDSEVQSKYIKPALQHKLPLQVHPSGDRQMENTSTGILQSTSLCESKVMSLEAINDHHHHLCQKGNVGVALDSGIADKNPNVMPLNSVGKDNLPFGGNKLEKHGGILYSSPGKNFYLNRLEYVNHGHGFPGHHCVISLPELLYPVESISRMFIATFTSDLKWFLSYCQIPFHLPLTIACHNSERCWSSRPNDRISMPYPDYPNLVVVYPPFPESVAFSNDRKKQGIACHHPKLLVLQREDTIRIVITSANLVEKQWNSVTNTIWWQDFPRVSSADYGSLFPKLYSSESHLDSKCDFAAQLAGFMASLLIDVPSQAHWIIELTRYDFGGATGHLVPSVPGIHLYRTSVMSESLPSSTFLGSVASSVVGIGHLFRTAADSKGARLKKLAAFLGKSCKVAYGRLEIVLRRDPNVPADANAVSVLVPDPDGRLLGECVQLGFLPRNVAQWISPLWDAGFFSFSGYVCPKEALAAALGENCKKVQLILYVSEGHHFQDIKIMQSEHMGALCSLVASIQRCYGLWRLQEVLNRYRWPESLESDFIYGSSSIGSSVSPQFLAAFSAAAGKKSSQYFDSEESDPEWGYWNAKEELKNPSIRIIFPTIERVKNAYNGVLPSRHILCLSERTWQRLKTLDILHDAIPHPHDRIGHPMHVKVVRRRFLSERDAPSVGWVYCGSHNFSAAAWGRQISNPFGTKTEGPQKGNPSLDSRLHICNYELGIVFTFPIEDHDSLKVNSTNLDDIVLPFVLPAPKYGSRDRPATMQAMREAMAEPKQEDNVEEEIMEEITEGEEEMEATNYVAVEKEEEKAYAEILWNHVELFHSC